MGLKTNLTSLFCRLLSNLSLNAAPSLQDREYRISFPVYKVALVIIIRKTRVPPCYDEESHRFHPAIQKQQACPCKKKGCAMKLSLAG